MGLIAVFKNFSVSIDMLLNIYTFTRNNKNRSHRGASPLWWTAEIAAVPPLTREENSSLKKLQEKRMNFGEEENFLVTGFPNQFSQQIGRLHVMLNAIGH